MRASGKSTRKTPTPQRKTKKQKRAAYRRYRPLHESMMVTVASMGRGIGSLSLKTERERMIENGLKVLPLFGKLDDEDFVWAIYSVMKDEVEDNREDERY